jgi:hypothetical protein
VENRPTHHTASSQQRAGHPLALALASPWRAHMPAHVAAPGSGRVCVYPRLAHVLSFQKQTKKPQARQKVRFLSTAFSFFFFLFVFFA